MSLMSFLTMRDFLPEIDDPKYPLDERLRAHKLGSFVATLWGAERLNYEVTRTKNAWAASPEGNGPSVKDARHAFLLLDAHSTTCDFQDLPQLPAGNTESTMAEQIALSPSSYLTTDLYEDARAYHLVAVPGSTPTLIFSVNRVDEVRAVDDCRRRHGTEPLGVFCAIAAATKCALSSGAASKLNSVILVASAHQVLIIVARDGRTLSAAMHSVEDADSVAEVVATTKDELKRSGAGEGGDIVASLFTTPSAACLHATLQEANLSCAHVPLTVIDLCFA